MSRTGSGDNGEMVRSVKWKRSYWWILSLVVIWLLARGLSSSLLEKGVMDDNLRLVKVAVAIDRSSVDSSTSGEFRWERIPILCKAIERHRVAIARYLIESGADLRAADRAGLTVLHYAAERGDADLVRLLLAHGADPNAVSHLGENTLFDAVRYRRESVARLLLDAGVKANVLNHRNEAPIEYAVAAGSKRMFIWLRDAGAKTDVPMVFVYSAFGDAAGLKAELRRNPHMANRKGLYGWRPIDYAANSGRASTIDVLLWNGVKPDGEVLALAVSSGNRDAVSTLLSHGCDVNGRGRWKETMLELAIAARDSAMVRYLVRAGADTTLRTSWGISPEKFARRRGNAEVIRCFEDVSRKRSDAQDRMRDRQDR